MKSRGSPSASTLAWIAGGVVGSVVIGFLAANYATSGLDNSYHAARPPRESASPQTDTPAPAPTGYPVQPEADTPLDNMGAATPLDRWNAGPAPSDQDRWVEQAERRADRDADRSVRDQPPDEPPPDRAAPPGYDDRPPPPEEPPPPDDAPPDDDPG